MNERIDQLLVKAGAYLGGEGVDYSNFDTKKFAELIVQECQFAIVSRMDLPKHERRLYNNVLKQHFGVEE